MKHIKLFLALAVALLLGACTSTPKVWDEVAWIHSTTNVIAIEQVEYTDTATILTVHEKNTPGYSIRIPHSTHLVGNKGKEYRIIGGEGIDIGEKSVTPESGEAYFRLFFEPMPKRTSCFDYIEGHGYDDFCIYGLHTPSHPIKIPAYKHSLTDGEMAESFLRTDTVHIRGKIEGYSRDMGFKTLYVKNTSTLTNEDHPAIININEDGTFEGSYVSAHPMFTTVSMKSAKHYWIMSVYTVPGCTTELHIDKNGNLMVSSPDDAVQECKRIVEERVFDRPLFSNHNELVDSISRLGLDEYIAFIDKRAAAYDKLARYIAWKYKFTPTEQYYMWLNGKVEHLYSIFEHDSRSSRTALDSLALEFDTYKCLHDMPCNSVACLAISNYYYAINRYEYSSIIQKGAQNHRLSSVDYVTHTDTTIVNNDMKVMGASEPTLLSSIMLLRDARYTFEFFRNYYKEDMATFVERRKALLVHPFLKSEFDRLYALELEAQKPTWTLPECEATGILRRMTDKYRGKYLMIDFWDMGCGPCRAAIERSKEMRKAFRDHPDVDFLFIASPMSSQEAYDAYVKENLDGEDCHLINHDDYNSLMQLFKFLSIPHYETLDREGNVLNKCLHFSTPDEFAAQLIKLKKEEAKK